METYYIPDGFSNHKKIECVPTVCTDDAYYNCSFCGNVDCRYYEEIVLVEPSAA